MKNKIKRDDLIIIGIIIIYTAINIILAGYHEAWRDESQAWVLVKGSTIPEIFGLCASEGHPVLWFLFLYPFTRLGFSFYHFSYISIVLMAVAAFIWLKKAPFNRAVKICVLLSPLFFYYNPVICRIYALLMINLLLICVLWKDRHDHPVYYGMLVALLFQTHMLMSGMAIGMTVDMALELREHKDDKKKVMGLSLPLASFILLIMELRQDSSTETFLNVGPSSILGNLRLRHIYDVLYSFAGKFGPVAGWVILAASIAFLLYLFVCFIKRSEWKRLYLREFIVILCTMAVYGGVMFLVRSADHIQIAIIFWMYLMFICWELKEKENLDGMHGIVTVFLAAVCILAMPNCLYTDIAYEIREQYSGGEEIAALINERVPAGSAVILKNDLFSPSLYAYLCESPNGYYIWDVENVEEYTIHKWGKVKKRELTDAEVPEYIRIDFDSDTDCYFASNKELEDEGLELIAKNSSKSKWYEDFYVYHVDLEP